MARRRDDRRTDAREQALILLYEADTRALSVDEVLAAQVVRPDDLACTLVEGVAEHRDRIDELISTYARGWTLDRMPVIDRAVLRLGSFELLGRADVPVAVVLDEAVELVKRFSTEDSGRFVNGVLSSIAGAVRSPA
jgi:N utilization substance protein B